MDIDHLVNDLVDEEGWRSGIYDDANGKFITKGSVVQGTPTVGCGLTGPFTKDELMPITRSRAIAVWQTLQKAIPWVVNLDEPRQRALTDMGYNLGVTKLLGFNDFLGFMRTGDFDGAADDLATTLWAKQVGNRATRIGALIRGTKTP